MTDSNDSDLTVHLAYLVKFYIDEILGRDERNGITRPYTELRTELHAMVKDVVGEHVAWREEDTPGVLGDQDGNFIVRTDDLDVDALPFGNFTEDQLKTLLMQLRESYPTIENDAAEEWFLWQLLEQPDGRDTPAYKLMQWHDTIPEQIHGRLLSFDWKQQEDEDELPKLCITRSVLGCLTVVARQTDNFQMYRQRVADLKSRLGEHLVDAEGEEIAIDDLADRAWSWRNA